MDIYSEYENNKYFRILWTFVLPDWKWNSWDIYDDLFRYPKRLPFWYKLDSYNKDEWNMELILVSRMDWDLNTTKQDNLSEIDLKERSDLTTEEIKKIYGILDEKYN